MIGEILKGWSLCIRGAHSDCTYVHHEQQQQQLSLPPSLYFPSLSIHHSIHVSIGPTNHRPIDQSPPPSPKTTLPPPTPPTSHHQHTTPTTPTQTARSRPTYIPHINPLPHWIAKTPPFSLTALASLLILFLLHCRGILPSSPHCEKTSSSPSPARPSCRSRLPP